MPSGIEIILTILGIILAVAVVFLIMQYAIERFILITIPVLVEFYARIKYPDQFTE